MPFIFDAFQAIRNNDAEALQRLVNLDAYDHNATFQGTTSLSLTVYLGNLRCFDILLESGAPLNTKSMDHLKRSETPIISSIRLGRKEIFWKLLHRGAKLDIPDFYNQTPLWFAVKEQRVSFVKLLLSMGAPITFVEARESPLNLVVQFLCYRVRRDLAVELVDAGLQTNLIDANNKTPLLWALYHSDFSFFYLLIESGCPFNLTIRNKDYKIPLKWTQDVHISSWLKKERGVPVPLMRQCRSMIRNYLRIHYNKDVRPIIRSLPLPNVLINYLLMVDTLSLTDFHRDSSKTQKDCFSIPPLDQLMTSTSSSDPFSIFLKENS